MDIHVNSCSKHTVMFVHVYECMQKHMHCIPEAAATDSLRFSHVAAYTGKEPQKGYDMITIRKTNIAPEDGWLEDCVPFGKAYVQVLC